jgi:diadenosine tetraphosphatase ApaH/serine/threonine PP2A family protein phosphatase
MITIVIVHLRFFNRLGLNLGFTINVGPYMLIAVKLPVNLLLDWLYRGLCQQFRLLPAGDCLDGNSLRKKIILISSFLCEFWRLMTF